MWKPKIRTMVSLICLGAFVGLAQAKSDEESLFRQNFDKINSLELELSSVHTSRTRGDVIKSKRRIWQDGASRRCDERREVYDLDGTLTSPEHRIFSLETPEKLFYWEEGPADNLTDNYAWYKLADKMGKDDLGRKLPFDARMLGIVPRATFQLREGYFDMVVGAARPAPANVEPISGGRLVTFTRTDGEVIRLTFEYRGSQPLLIRTEIGAGKTRAIGEFGYASEPREGIWFPQRADIRLEKSGKAVLDEHTDIKLISVNRPLSAHLFSLSSMHIPAGVWVDGTAVPVALNEAGSHVEWNGRELQKVHNHYVPRNDVRNAGSPFRNSTSWRILQLFGGLLIVAGSIALAIISFRRFHQK